MSVLDLQSVKPVEEFAGGNSGHGGPPQRSGASKQCGGDGNSDHAENTSTLSVAICAF